MDLQTISAVSKNFQISTRTLRYYEQIGLLKSVKQEGYAYRTYDEAAIRRLEQIIVLRKLRIQLKDIQSILQKEEATTAITIFQNKVNDLSDEITALTTIKDILEEFIIRLRNHFDVKINLRLLSDESLLKTIDSLTITKIQFKEDTTMEDLKSANEKLSNLSDVRIIYLPPCTVASIQAYCEDPELTVGQKMDQFVKESALLRIKPDLRHLGFNNPCFINPPSDGPDHGYEVWVTIPEDFTVPEYVTKKNFTGGLYAAHMIKMGDFHEWEWLVKWAEHNEEYEPNWGDPMCMHGLLEEQLNYFHNIQNKNFRSEQMQLDLLLPIKLKSN